MYKKNFLILFIFYVSYLWFNYFSRSILPTHFLEQGLSFSQIILGTLLQFLSQAILLSTWTRLSSKLSWRLALTSFFVYILLIITIRNSLQFVVASLFSGLGFFFFY